MEHPSPQIARRRRLLAFACASAVAGLLAAILSVCRISLLPPGFSMRELQTGAAVTHILVDLPQEERHHVSAPDFETMTHRASLVGDVLASPPVLGRIADRLEIDPGSLAAASEVTEGVPSALTEPDAERRASEILDSHDPYRLDIQAKPTLPVIDVYAQAPTAAKAQRLANATAGAGNEYMRTLAARDGFPVVSRVQLTQLGGATGGALDPTAPVKIFALTFIVVFGVCFGVLALIAELRRGWLRAGRTGPGALFPVPPPAPATPEPGGSWPHTTRALPWMIAAFISMLWLVPFNTIELGVSLPVDLKLDRLLLPVIALSWGLAIAIGGRGAPRWRFTPVHAAIAAFAAVAGLSVVLNAAYLNQTLELGLSVKKLALLVSYLSIFVIIASSVRKSEVRAFLNLTLGLAVICALGVLWEYRFDYNVFYVWSQKLLPSVFQFTSSGADGVDEIGRRLIVGPTEHGLEVVSMLSMALPIAIVGLMQDTRTRNRVLYGLAICLLVGASLSTYRKSAILAPISACLVLAYFRRRELLKLAPFGLVLLIAIPVLSPNALGSVIDQLKPNRLGVSTVSDRVSDYDAIRPDILSHPVFGRGYGSYDHNSYRILDNDMLTRLVESGIAGLIAFVLIVVTIIATAAPVIRSRDPARAPPALAIAAGAAPFLVLSALFDIMSFPHAPYVLLTLAGLLAVIVRSERSQPAPARRVATPAEEPIEDEPQRPESSVPVPA
jgi:O-antigen ligase/polysaccharide polymerase Wzy-like membrane protein